MIGLQFLYWSLLALFPGVKGYDIRVQIKNAASDTLLLAYYYAEKQFVKDTAIASNGIFQFKGDSTLEAGVYILVMPPKYEPIQLFINEEEQHLTIDLDAKQIAKSFQVKGSRDNELFYDYLRYLEEKRPQAQAISDKIKTEKEAGRDVAVLQENLEKINGEVKNKQSEIIKNFPASMTAILINASIEVTIPEMKGTQEQIEMNRYLYYKAHYFDHLKLEDPRLLRSPLIHERINYYLEKLTLQHPDSIKHSLDDILRRIQPAEETFRYYLVQFLNNYANSKIVGFDALYVHLVDEYYSKGFAPWVAAEQLEKIQKNASALRPILIGKTAPEIRLTRYPEQTPITLHGIRSPYTVLFIWDPECSHCKSSLPHVIDFYNKYKAKGVEVLAVCSQFSDKVPACWKYLEEHNIKPGWINAADPFHASKYKVLYDVRTTPQLFIMDAKKTILSKNIGAEQLSEVMDNIILRNKS